MNQFLFIQKINCCLDIIIKNKNTIVKKKKKSFDPLLIII